MKIVNVTDEFIEFEDGSKITYDHDQDCCEYNYAQFDALDDIALNTDFDLDELAFQAIDGSGFRFGNLPSKMFFVPCYSFQNGYYSSDIDIYFNSEKVLNFGCKEQFD